MPTIRCVLIHLMPAARDRAARAEFPGGGKQSMDYIGPDFQDVKDCYSSGDCIHVHTKDGAVYMYPVHQVARVKMYDREVLA